MKILMYHTRAGGHNILPFLEFFNESEEYELNFAYSQDRTYYPEKCRIKFHKISFAPHKIFETLKLIGDSYDLIWYHGGHSSYIFYFFSLFRSKKSTFVFNIWNEWLIHKAAKNDFKGKLFQKAIKKADFVQCNWHGTAKILEEKKWAKSIKVFYWGLQKDYFKEFRGTLSSESQNFISGLPLNKVKFFFPKSISHASRHDLIIEACAGLKEMGLKNYIVYFWLGNVNEPSQLADLRNKIETSGLNEHIEIVEHGFLPFADIIEIWKHMDVGLQIAANDQISTSFIEPQLFEKEVIASNILPYRIYNEVFEAEIPLIELNQNAIKDKMAESVQSEGKGNMNLLEKRRQIVKDNFNFDSNIHKILTFYSEYRLSLSSD